MTLGSPPENPEYTSEPKVLTPVSPKPLHYPVPSNIPVLENQIDPVFNLTTSHMAEAAPQQPQSQLDSSFTAEYPSNGASQTSPNYDMSNQTAGQDVSSSAGEGSGEAQVQQAGANSQMSYDPARYQATEASSEHDRLQASQNPPPPLSASSAHEPTPTSSDVDTQRQPLSLFSIITQSQPNGVTASGADNTGGIDYQQLLQTLSPSTANPSQTEGAALPSTAFDTSNTQPPPPGVDSSSATAVSGPPAGLPPRPPPQEQPSIHPNYTHAKDIRDYHPHSQHPALNPTSQQSNAYRSTSQSYPAAPYQAVPGANGLPPPPLASFQQQSAPYPSQSQSPNSQARAREVLESQREIKQAAGEILDDDDAPWTPERQRQYDNFLDEERRYVTEGNWEQFPHGSRLFVGKKIEKFNKPVQTADGATGNLSSEKVTKRDIFHVFSNYGSLAQISIKQAYGFVQFLSTDDCTRALQAQQGRIIRGKKIHLEVSKPQKNRNDANRRRSRSPDHARGNAPAAVDRYVSGQGGRRDRNQNNRAGGRGRDDYRPGRSPSPRGYRTRDRSRDRYDGRYRSRSRSPYRGGGRYRSPTPEHDLPLPRRAPENVPEVQIIVLDGLDRNFVEWVERGFTARGLRADVLLLSPRLSEAAVIKRQIVEGVTAVVRLTKNNQNTAKIPLQVFDRRNGADVRFEEYDGLEPHVAAELVIRGKANNAPQLPSYGYGYGGSAPSTAMPPAAMPPQAQQPPNLSNLITSLDPMGLQKLLGVMQTPATPQSAGQQAAMLPSASTALTPDLAKMLAGAGPGMGAQSGFGGQHNDPLAALRSNPALAGLLGANAGVGGTPAQVPGQPPQGQSVPGANAAGQPDMAEILARLGSYRR
ncbi:nuclear polyadenylated RNA-binding protein 3 [Zalaria obscura]|uniref:Nuclear polyadenylated RNA-binding protein 3 n=1 Tax=Zalaria obscura TaxID=2024903 RepID=A0ACC3SPH2_9PEZI